MIRYLFGFLCVCALVATSPQSASAQASEEAVPKVALATPTQHRLPPQLVLRASYFLYLDEDADNGGTSDQTERKAEGPKSAQAPGTEVPEIDTLSQRAIERYEIQSEEKKKHERRRRRGLRIGVPIAVATVVALVVVGAVGASYARSGPD